ncbi:MAG: hypothetical protein LBB13_01245 [Rickettsiales bacterium]|jgi:hypothetical protein|nr:hypothetical protein [Rickettsiales bacterium]
MIVNVKNYSVVKSLVLSLIVVSPFFTLKKVQAMADKANNLMVNLMVNTICLDKVREIVLSPDKFKSSNKLIQSLSSIVIFQDINELYESNPLLVKFEPGCYEAKTQCVLFRIMNPTNKIPFDIISTSSNVAIEIMIPDEEEVEIAEDAEIDVLVKVKNYFTVE